MRHKYKQLTLEEREEIYKLEQQKIRKSDIADAVGHHKSTIYRELNRNKSSAGYLPDTAHKLFLDRCCKGLKIDRNPELKKYIIEKLNDDWSPEMIAGYLKKEKGITVISHETIYAYIYSKEGNKNKLYLTLRKRHKKRKSKMAKKSKSSKIPNRVSIHDRPANIDTRDTFGHWEGDLVLFSNTTTNLITLRERKSRLLVTVSGTRRR